MSATTRTRLAGLSRGALAALACAGIMYAIASCKGAAAPAGGSGGELVSGAGGAGTNPSTGTSASAGASASGVPGATPTFVRGTGCEAQEDPLDCYAERAALIEGLLGDLYALQSTRDKRGVPAALDALEIDEPDVQVVALDVLGPFASEPGVGAKVLPWLLADDPRREARAAEVLARTKDAGLERLAREYFEGHRGEHAAPPLAGYWRDPTPHGLAAYPGARRFPPGDSRRAIGLRTADDVEKVLAFYAAGTTARPLDPKGYRDRRAKAQQLVQSKFEAVLKSPEFLARQKRLDDLINEYKRTQDPKVLEKIARMDKDDPIPLPKAFDAVGALEMPLPPLEQEPMKDARWLILEERDGVPARAIATWREPAIDETVIVLAWNPATHDGPPVRRTIRVR
jgi:hypothetical protein